MNTEKIISFCKLNNIKWAFFDYFGTTALRNCTGEEIKRFWAKKMSENLLYAVSAENLYKTRISAEKKLWSKSLSKEIVYSELLKEIYIRLKMVFDFEFEENEFFKLSKTAELYCEKVSQEPLKEITDLMLELKRMGIKIAIVSDFYLSKEYFKEFLSYHNLNEYIDEIFVSCEYKKSKHFGTLYSEVLDTLSVNPKECIMIGDNENSDIVNAEAKGIKAFKIISDEIQNKAVTENEFKKVYKTNFKGKLRYSNYAFSLYFWCERLYKCLIKKQLFDVFFLAREGQFLKLLFDEYLKSKDICNIKTHYVFASRKATFPACLKPIEVETFEIFDSYKSFRIIDLIDNVGIDYENNRSVFEGFDIEKDIIDFFNSQTFAQLKENKEFCELYNKTVTEKREIIKRYLNECGIAKNNRIALVDVGWNATMQDRISALLPEVSVEGFFIGIINNAVISDNSRKTGLLFSHIPFESEDLRCWEYDHVFFERLLWADHGATESYIEKGGRIEPVLKEYESEKKNYERMKPVQDAIILKLKRLEQIFNPSPYIAEDFYELFKQYHIRMLFTVNKSQLVLQRQMIDAQMQNFGKITTAAVSLDETFSKKRIIKKIFKRIRLIKNTELVFRILQRYNCFTAIKILYFFKKKSMLKDISKTFSRRCNKCL